MTRARPPRVLVSAVCSLGGVCRLGWAAAGGADIHTISIPSIPATEKMCKFKPLNRNPRP